MKFVVTAGPTREPIDPVRYISNRSSGKMGYAIAEAARDLGNAVTLISGPVNLAPPLGVQWIAIVTSEELYERTREAVADCDVLVMCAAVADYKPVKSLKQKSAKQIGAFSLALTPTRDVLASLAQRERSFFVAGFAAETHDLAARAQEKLQSKNCDMIIANDVSRTDIGMESDENEVTIFFRNGEQKTISRAPKKIIAREIVKIISQMHQKSLTKKT